MMLAGHFDPILQAGISVIAQGQWFIGKQTVQAANFGTTRIQLGDIKIGTKAAQRGDMWFVFGVVDKCTEKNLMLGDEMFKQIVRTYLVSLVGG